MSNCDHCATELSDRRFYLDRNVEYYLYKGTGDSFSEMLANTQVNVLYSDSINRFCCAGCAEIGVPQALHSLGLKILQPGIGPIETCAKCNGPVNMAEPHIAYGLMEATKVSKPWLTHLDVHHDEYLCVVCPKCDGNLMESEWQVAEDKKTEILQSLHTWEKERA